MTKLILAGVAALALSTGVPFAGGEQPASEYRAMSAQDTQLTQRNPYLRQQQRGPSWHNVLRYYDAVPVIAVPKEPRGPFDCWADCP